MTQGTDCSQTQGSFANDSMADGTLLAGDNLVALPKKVNKSTTVGNSTE